MRKKRLNNQAGFTVIELMIATLIFTIILLICLVSITQIGKLYYKGISVSQTQEFMRNLSSDLTQQIQFGNLPDRTFVNGSPSTPLIFCAGDFRYRAVFNRELGSTGVDSVLKRKPYSGLCQLDESLENFDGAVELAPRGMRIQRLKIINAVGSYDGVTPIAGVTMLWKVDIKVALGGDDLLEFPASPNDDPVNYEAVRCKNGLAGSEFCATAELTTYVNRRIR